MFYFLMCSERSGSNFLTKLMDGHSRICGPAAKHIINPVARNLFRYEPLERAEHWDTLLRDMYRLLNIDFSVWKKHFSPEELHQLAAPGDIKGLISGIFNAEAAANGKEHVFIKENQVYAFMTFLLLRYPESKFVYQVRDPRDMALSWKRSALHPGGVVRAAKQWKKDQQNYLKQHNELRKRDRSCLLRYEDLLEEPESELTRVLHFMGLEYEARMLDFHRNALTRKNAGMQPSWNNLSRQILRKNKNKYPEALSEREIKAVEKICHYEMRILGYAPEYPRKTLKAMNESELEELEMKEHRYIKWEIPDNVRDNMEAKSVFYRKELDDA